MEKPDRSQRAFSVRMPFKEYSKLKVMSFRQRKSVNFLINQAVRELLYKHKEEE